VPNLSRMRFFFYGTLLDGSDNPVARSIHAKLETEGAATAPGSLHAIPDSEGWFPAMLPGPGEVRGALYRATARFTASDLARMDAYENCDPANRQASLYCREEVVVTTREGTAIRAQAYLFAQALPGGAMPIADGDFRAWLAATGLDAFGGTHTS
jgi:gamma-glutamylcyclotransferase (GGCT)/AIG2-like uncharacterized protein YtfP